MSISRRSVVVLALLTAGLAAGCMGSRGTAENSYLGDDRGGLEETFGDPQLAKELIMEEHHDPDRVLVPHVTIEGI